MRAIRFHGYGGPEVLQVVAETAFPLEEAGAAQALGEAGHVAGKRVVLP